MAKKAEEAHVVVRVTHGHVFHADTPGAPAQLHGPGSELIMSRADADLVSTAGCAICVESGKAE